MQKINKHATAVLGSNRTPWYLSQRNETLHSHKSLSTNVHSSFIHGRWQLEPAQIFFSQWMVKQTTLYPWNRVHHSNKKKKINSWHMQWPRWISKELHWVKKANSKGYMLYNAIYITFWKWWNYGTRKQIRGCQGLGGEAERIGREDGCGYKRIAWGVFMVAETFSILTVVVGTRTCTGVKIVWNLIQMNTHTQLET